jgi:hypothetical protein
LEVGCARGLCPTNVMSLYTNLIDDAPLNFLRNPNVRPKVKHKKKIKIEAHSLAYNIRGREACWNYGMKPR